MRRSLFLVPMALALLATSLLATSAAGQFPLKDGDLWVLAGDSITAQHQHSNYIEAFCHARYPKGKFAFRNSGVGGHTIPTTLARFDYDIAAWKPTIVSVELGMNDKGGTSTEKYIENMKVMVERIRGIKARPIIFAASPVNSGDTMKSLGGNKKLHDYAEALKGFTAKENILYADQFHALLDIWGNNKPIENRLNAVQKIKEIARDNTLVGVEHLKAFLAEQEKNPIKGVSMLGDPVHPGQTGQLMMAAAILKELKAEGFVSSADIDVASKTAKAKGCAVDNIQASSDKIAFDRLDESSPFPIPDEARPVLFMAPDVFELSQYTLKLTGLKSGQYALTIDGMPIAKVTAKDLEAGVNLTDLGASAKNPITAHGKAILGAVSNRAAIVGRWRGVSKAAIAPDAPATVKTQLAEINKEVEAADELIRKAAQPRKMRFELTLVP